MTPENGVTDGQLGAYFRKMGAISSRLGKSLPFEDVMMELQRIHDGHFNHALPKVFCLTVDYKLTAEEMFKRGPYVWDNNSFHPQDFPIEGSGVVEFEASVLRPAYEDFEIILKDVEALDKSNPWSVARIEHLMAFGKAFPRQVYRVAAPGSFFKMSDGDVPDREATVSFHVSRKLQLELIWRDMGGLQGQRILIVRKVSPPV